MIAFASSIDKPCAFQIGDQLTHFSRHSSISRVTWVPPNAKFSVPGELVSCSACPATVTRLSPYFVPLILLASLRHQVGPQKAQHFRPGIGLGTGIGLRGAAQGK